jgi:hypothetical protein
MATTIKSDIGEQVIQSRPLRTFEVPDLSDQVYEPLPAMTNEGLHTRYPDAAPVGAFNARQAASRNMSFEDIKRSEEAMKAAKTAKFAPSRLSATAKKRIEMICGISRVNRSVVIDGETYTLQTLKSYETREALLAASQFDGSIESPFEIRRQLLAYALCSVAGTDVEMFLETNRLEARLDMLDELPEMLLVKLMDEYNKMMEEVQTKYFPKTEAAAAEVIEDLKK